MTNKTNSSYYNPVARLSPKKRERSCSLFRVLSVVCIGAAAIFGGYVYNNSSVQMREISRNQIPPYQRPCEAVCAPGPLFSSFDSTRSRGERAPTTRVESQMLHPGIIALDDGRMGYANTKRDLSSHSHHAKMVKSVYRQVKDHPGVVEAVASAKVDDHKGFAVVVNDPLTQKNTTCLYALNPRKIENQKKADKHVQGLIQGLSELSEKQICNGLLGAHRTLFAGIESLSAGEYRDQAVLVFKDDDEDQDRSAQAIMNLILKRGGTKKEAALYKNTILSKLKAKQEDFSTEERAVIKKIAFLPPASKEIPRLMVEYARNLKAMMNQMKSCEDFDPVAFASYAHQELGRIHPFSDGNGRMARLVMNGILKEAGYQAVVFPTDEEYSAAVLEEQDNPGYFARYLRDTAIPWTESQFGPSMPCLPDLSC